MGKSGGSAAAVESLLEDRSGYFKQYYEENRDSINQKRTDRYHSNPEYRRRVLEASQRYRENHRTPMKVRRSPKFQPFIMVAGDGNELRLFQVGVLALAVNRSVQSISHWEAKGVIPTTPYRDKRGHRYYSAPMIRAVRSIIDGRARIPPGLNVGDQIKKRWVELGVPMRCSTMKTALLRTVVPDVVEYESNDE